MSQRPNDFVKTKLFTPQSLDVEQIVLNLINELGLSAIRVQTVGDATQANTVFTMLALNLDSFVFSLLTSDKTKDWDEYIKERDAITSRWPEKKIGSNDNDHIYQQARQARKLYELTVKTWANQRLFKVRRFSYFGVGWKESQIPDISKLERVDEEQEEQDTDEA